jgi:hypothetical protein
MHCDIFDQMYNFCHVFDITVHILFLHNKVSIIDIRILVSIKKVK